MSSVYEDIKGMAEAYIEMSLPIIPLCSHNHRKMSMKHKERCKTPGKAPVLPKWPEKMSTSYEDVQEWFDRNPYGNIGMVLGKTASWNIVGVDIDGQSGEDAWQKLQEMHGEAPATWEYSTSSGRRLLYTLPDSCVSQKYKVCWKEGHEELAFIAQGQQTVMPPSVHPSGVLYQWREGRSPFDADISLAPKWLQAKVSVSEEQQQTPMSTPVTREEYSQEVREGGRSEAIARLVGYLCSKRELPKATVLQTAKSHNLTFCKPPLSDAEVEAAVNSIWESEEAKHKKRLEKSRKRATMTPRVLAEYFYKKEYEDGVRWMYFVERDRFYKTTVLQGPWTLVDDIIVESSLEKFLHKIDPLLSRESTIQEVKKFLARLLTSKNTGERLDIGKYPDLRHIVLKNGVFDWIDKELKPWDPDKYITTVQVAATYNEAWKESEAYDVWQEALRSWLPDQQAVDFLQEYIGYCLVPSCGYRTAVFLYGEGANGKSLFLDIVVKLFGDECVAHTQPQALIRRFGTTVLIDKMIAVCSDIDSSYLSNTGVLKQIISGDPIAAEYKGGKNFDFVPVARLLFSANALPKSSDKSHGWYSRLRFVPFPYQFKPDPKYKKMLTDTMLSEEGRSVLFGWAMEGLARLSSQGSFTNSPAMQMLASVYRCENDSVAAFLAEQLEDSPLRDGTYKTSLVFSIVYQVYTEWCVESGQKSVGKREFANRLKNLGVDSKTLRFKTPKGKWKSSKFLVDKQFVEDVEFDGKTTYNSYYAVVQ